MVKFRIVRKSEKKKKSRPRSLPLPSAAYRVRYELGIWDMAMPARNLGKLARKLSKGMVLEVKVGSRFKPYSRAVQEAASRQEEKMRRARRASRRRR